MLLWNAQSFYKQVAAANIAPRAFQRMLGFWSWYNRAETERLLEVVKEGLARATADAAPGWCRTGQMLLEVADAYHAYRAESFARALVRNAKQFKKYPKYSKCLLTFFYDMVRRDGDVRRWADNNKEALAWVQKWGRANNFRVPAPAPAASTLPPPPAHWSAARVAPSNAGAAPSKPLVTAHRVEAATTAASVSVSSADSTTTTTTITTTVEATFTEPEETFDGSDSGNPLSASMEEALSAIAAAEAAEALAIAAAAEEEELEQLRQQHEQEEQSLSASDPTATDD